MLGCWAACGLLKIAKGNFLCHPSLPSCCTRSKVPLAGPFTRQRGCSPGTAVWEQRKDQVVRGAGFAHGCLLAICICSKKARRVQEGLCSQGLPVLGEGQPGSRVPRCLAPVDPAVLLSLAPGPAAA